MTRWSVEQGLAWIMWRDDARVSETGDGRLGTILPRDTAQAPVLGETGTDEIERRLLETGSVDQQWPDSAMGPYPRRERLVTLHEESGCIAQIVVRRNHMGGPACLVERLCWRPTQQVPHVPIKEALEQLHTHLKAGEITAFVEIDGDAHPVHAEQWLYRAIGFSSDRNVGANVTINGKKANRVRLDQTAMKKLWPRLRARRELTGAATGKWYRQDVIERSSDILLEREARMSRPATTDDDIQQTVLDLIADYDEDGGCDRTAKRWVQRVRSLMESRRRL